MSAPWDRGWTLLPSAAGTPHQSILDHSGEWHAFPWIMEQRASRCCPVTVWCVNSSRLPLWEFCSLSSPSARTVSAPLLQLVLAIYFHVSKSCLSVSMLSPHQVIKGLFLELFLAQLSIGSAPSHLDPGPSQACVPTCQLVLSPLQHMVLLLLQCLVPPLRV